MSATKKPGRHIQWYYAILLSIACVFAYDPSRWDNSAGDTISARYWPVAVLEHGTWKLDPFQKDLAGVIYTAIFTNNATTLYPRNGWGMLAFTLPFYKVADVLDWGGTGWTHDRINHVARWNAIFLSTCSVVLLFFFLCQFTSIRVALFSSAFFAFGTWNWSMATQGLYSQTPAVLTHMIGLHLLWRICKTPDGKSVPLLAIFLGLTHATIWSLRPQDILLIAPAIFVMKQKRSVVPYVLAGASVVVPLLMGYKEVYGFYTGAYGVIESLPGVVTWQTNGLAGFAGMLFSPNRGAIVFFPLLLAVPYLASKYLPSLKLKSLFEKSSKKPSSVIPENFILACALGIGCYLSVLSFIYYWHGGWAYGPRYLYDLLPYIWPLLTLMFEDIGKWLTSRPGALRLPKPVMALFILLTIQSVVVHALGHFNFDIYVWNFTVGEVSNKTVWDTSHFILTDTWRAGSNAHRWDKSTALKRLHEYGF